MAVGQKLLKFRGLVRIVKLSGANRSFGGGMTADCAQTCQIDNRPGSTHKPGLLPKPTRGLPGRAEPVPGRPWNYASNQVFGMGSKHHQKVLHNRRSRRELPVWTGTSIPSRIRLAISRATSVDDTAMTQKGQTPVDNPSPNFCNCNKPMLQCLRRPS